MKSPRFARLLTRTTRHALLAAAAAALVVGWTDAAVAAPNGAGLGGPGTPVPEISAGALGGAMTLLSGGLLLLRERVRAAK